MQRYQVFVRAGMREPKYAVPWHWLASLIVSFLCPNGSYCRVADHSCLIPSSGVPALKAYADTRIQAMSMTTVVANRLSKIWISEARHSELLSITCLLVCTNYENCL